MSYTEQDVERATQIFVWHWRSSGPRGETFTEAVRNGMRAALEAMEREPLESACVLPVGWTTRAYCDMGWCYAHVEGPHGSSAEGDGEDVPAAIRSAVAAAKGATS
ncbi:MAG TPA: hypothetical protein VKZ96_11480 [Thermomicrobiales bacterium]|nr:hypothetical protein [Thermomicrobiales bacterium]